MEKANVEKIVITWLENFLTDAWAVFGDRPNDTPDGYILVDRTGGKREAMVLDRAEILIEVYHKTSRVLASDKAHEIADNIRQLTDGVIMRQVYEIKPDRSLADYDAITRAEVNSIIKLDDTVNSHFRYQVYCDIWCRR